MALILASGAPGAIRRAVKTMDWSRARWAYMGAGTPPSQLPPKARLDLHGLMRAEFERARQPYISYVAALTATATQLSWVAGVTAEKNPYISRAFLYAVCASVCRDLERSQAEHAVVLIVDDPVLRTVIRGNCPVARMFDDGALKRLRRRAYQLTRRLGNLARFSARHLSRVWLARHRLKLHQLPAVQRAVGHADLVLTHVLVDLRAVDLETGAFRDADFSAVSEHLARAGAHVLAIPAVGYDAPYRKVVEHVRTSSRACLVPHAFLRLSDVVAEVAREITRRPGGWRGNVPRFGEIDMSDAVAADAREEWLGARRLEHGLLDRWTRRAAEHGLRVSRAIYPFENHAWERVWCASLRRWHHGVRIIGHQPNGLPHMLLNYFIAPSESTAAWLPDRIVTNGSYATRAMLDGGYSASLIRSGGGLRQSHVRAWLEAPLAARSREGRRPRVLVTPSIGTDATINLVDKVIGAFAAADHLDVWLKLHPAVSTATVIDARGIELPEWMTLTREPLSQLLPQVDVLVYNDGTFPGGEALALGVPVISVDLDFGVPLDALDGYPDVRERARTPEDIASAVRRCLARDPAEIDAFVRRARVVAGELVGRVDDSVLELFRA